MTLNDFFAWNMRRQQSVNDLPPLTEDDHDELFRLFEEAGLPATAMSAEMADGYLTACVIGPDPWPVHEWMEGIFGQPTLPVCDDADQQEQLLTLLLRRHQSISTALRISRADLTPDNLYLPLRKDIAPDACVSPYQLDPQGRRQGEWDCKDWAEGFRCMIVQDPQWHALTDDPKAASALLAPLVLFQMGYNPDHRELQIDEDQNLPALLVSSVYNIYEFWRDFKRSTLHASHKPGPIQNPFTRETPKPGRNEPCPCGSGLKYKKCCGA